MFWESMCLYFNTRPDQACPRRAWGYVYVIYIGELHTRPDQACSGRVCACIYILDLTRRVLGGPGDMYRLYIQESYILDLTRHVLGEYVLVFKYQTRPGVFWESLGICPCIYILDLTRRVLGEPRDMYMLYLYGWGGQSKVFPYFLSSFKIFFWFFNFDNITRPPGSLQAARSAKADRRVSGHGPPPSSLGSNLSFSTPLVIVAANCQVQFSL